MQEVTRLPLGRLADARGVEYGRGRRLDREAVRSHLRTAVPRLAVAIIGRPIRWFEGDAAFAEWKSELRDRIAETEAFYLEDFPGERAYVVTEWLAHDGDVVVVFEQYH